MDSTEIVYATVEEIIGKTGKYLITCSSDFNLYRLQRRYYTS
jgi:hypothetical protein